MSDRFNRYIDYWTNPELDKKIRIDRPSVPEQMDIINRDGATVVSAGAGSGKTTVLSLRFLRLILDEKAKVDEILTLTFTKKAAREMYERIHEHLKKAEVLFPEIITSQMKYFASASISTIDSFCSEIARTAPEKYGITRDFELLTNQEYAKMVKHVTANLFRKYPDLMTRLSRYIDPKKMESNLFAKLAKSLTIMTDTEKLFDVDKWFDLKNSLTSYLAAQLKDTLQSWDDWYYQHKGEISKAGSLLFPKDEKLCIIPELQRILATESSPWIKLAEQKFGTQRGNLQEHKPEIIAFKCRCHLLDTLNREDEAFWKSLMKLFADFAEELKTEKRKAGLLSYSDTEALAITILKENKDVRNWYRNKFKYIMIDEFQDNSSSQKELIYLIAGKDGNELSDDMDAEKLFFVGDAKQSIYRFRGADVSVFNRLSEELKEVGGESLPLNTNYRSEPTLVQHFNDVFRYAFHEEDLSNTPDTKAMWLKSMQLENADYSEANLHDHEAVFEETKQRKAKEGINSRIVLSTLDTTDIEEPNKLKASDCRTREAKRIIELIKDMTETDNWLIPEKDKSKGTLTRRPTVNDIAILLRKTSLQNVLEPMLAKEGIKYTVYGSNTVAHEALANDFTSYLKLLEYRKDKMAFLSVLRSPFVAMSDKGIHTLKNAFKKTELSKTAFSLELLSDEIDADDKLRYETGARFYDEMLEASRTSTPAALVEKLYYEGGYYAYLEADPTRRIYEEHFDYIWEEANNCTDIFSFMDRMKALMDNNNEDKIDTDLLRFDNDGVKIMTIHKSKGLAFPIVIIGDIYNDRKKNDSDYIIESPSRKSLYFHNKLITDTDEDIYLNNLVETQNRICENAEAKRLLYVAMTRAQYHLVATGSVKKPSKSDSDPKYEKVKYLSIGEIYEDALSSLRSEGAKMPGFEELPYTWETEEDRPEDKMETYTPNVEFYEKETVTLPEYKALKKGVKEIGLEISEPVVRNSSNKLPKFSPEVDKILKVKDRSASFGTLCHAMLEAKILKNPNLPEYESWNILPSEKKVLEAAADAIADRFLSSDFYKEITKGITPSDIHPEYEFYTIYNDDNGPIALEGSIDLFIEGTDSNIVIDYKTDTFKEPNIHKGQLSLYAKAMTEITNKPTRAYVVYLRNMEAVEIK